MGKIILLITLFFNIAFATNIFKISEYKLLPDTIDLLKIGVDLHNVCKNNLPTLQSCENSGWEKLRSPLSNDIEIDNVKTDTIDGFIQTKYFEITQNGKKLIDFSTKFVPTEEEIINQFSWGNNWVVEYADHIIVNGIDLNHKFGYSKSYGFSFYKGKPIYFYEKNGFLGINLDSIAILTNYKEALHYLCCEPSVFNPKINDCQICIYTKKDHFWYLIVFQK